MRGKCWADWMSEIGSQVQTPAQTSTHQPEFLFRFWALADYSNDQNGSLRLLVKLLIVNYQIHSFPVWVLWLIIFKHSCFCQVFFFFNLSRRRRIIHNLSTQVFIYKAGGKVPYCQILTLGSEFPLQIYTWFSN